MIAIHKRFSAALLGASILFLCSLASVSRAETASAEPDAENEAITSPAHPAPVEKGADPSLSPPQVTQQPFPEQNYKAPRDLMEQPLLYTAELGLNVLSVFSLESERRTLNKVGFQGGLAVDYFLGRFVGIGVGLSYATRGFELAAGTASASFLDIPFGVVFRTPSFFGGIDGTAISTFLLGGYASIPLGDFYMTGLKVNPTKTSFGIHFSGKHLFPVSEHVALGFATWGKIGLSNAFDMGANPNTGTLLEVGLGFVASYF